MNSEELAASINNIINDYFQRKAVRLGEPRYFPKDYLNGEYFEDRETMDQVNELCRQLAEVKQPTTKKATKK